MRIIVSQNVDKSWTGIIINSDKLYYSSYFYNSKNEAIDDLKDKINWKKGLAIEENDHPIIKVINDIINGKNFTVPSTIRYDFSGYTDKEVAVLKALSQVKAGDVITYGELAKLVGIPKGARFVGNVMKKNRFSPLIPCHRVVLANGKIGSFSMRGGSKLKMRLLKNEKVKINL